jgi:hypothetical protein
MSEVTHYVAGLGGPRKIALLACAQNALWTPMFTKFFAESFFAPALTHCHALAENTTALAVILMVYYTRIMDSVRGKRMNVIFCSALFGVAVTTTCLGTPITMWIDDSTGKIGTVDVNTGAVKLIGNAGIVLTDIAFDPQGNLYGVDFNSLYKISTSAGTASYVGSLGATSDANALVFGSDGTLYVSGLSGNFLTINPSTGQATVVGRLGFGFGSAGDLAFIDGALYLSDNANQLITVDLKTGHGTLVGDVGVAGVSGLATPDNITLYGVAGTSVYSISPNSGASTLVSNYAGAGLGTASGAAFMTEAVPEPSSLIYTIIPLLILTIGTLARRRCSCRWNLPVLRDSVRPESLIRISISSCAFIRKLALYQR